MNYTQLQMEHGWIAPAKVGDTGGASASAPGATTTMTPGWPATFGIAPEAPWADAYFYVPLEGDYSNTLEYTYEFSILFPTQVDVDACEAFEWEVQANPDGKKIYNGAWQCGPEGLRTFHYTPNPGQKTGFWEATNIPSPKIAPGEWNYFKGVFRRDPLAETMTHVSLQINSVVTAVNRTLPSTPAIQPTYMHAAFQLDSTQAAKPYSVKIKDMKVSQPLVVPVAAPAEVPVPVKAEPVPAPKPTATSGVIRIGNVSISVKPGTYVVTAATNYSDDTSHSQDTTIVIG